MGKPTVVAVVMNPGSKSVCFSFPTRKDALAFQREALQLGAAAVGVSAPKKPTKSKRTR